MTEKQKAVLDNWLQGRPQKVRDLAYEFPPYTIVKKACECHGDTVVVGYTEKDELICSEVDIFGCFDAEKSKLYIKAQDIRDGKVKLGEKREPYDDTAGKDSN